MSVNSLGQLTVWWILLITVCYSVNIAESQFPMFSAQKDIWGDNYESIITLLCIKKQSITSCHVNIDNIVCQYKKFFKESEKKEWNLHGWGLAEHPPPSPKKTINKTGPERRKHKCRSPTQDGAKWNAGREASSVHLSAAEGRLLKLSLLCDDNAWMCPSGPVFLPCISKWLGSDSWRCPMSHDAGVGLDDLSLRWGKDRKVLAHGTQGRICWSQLGFCHGRHLEKSRISHSRCIRDTDQEGVGRRGIVSMTALWNPDSQWTAKRTLAIQWQLGLVAVAQKYFHCVIFFVCLLFQEILAGLEGHRTTVSNPGLQLSSKSMFVSCNKMWNQSAVGNLFCTFKWQPPHIHQVKSHVCETQ
jgi:hypothetical protein